MCGFFNSFLWNSVLIYTGIKKATFVWNSNLLIIFPPFFSVDPEPSRSSQQNLKSKRKHTLTGRWFWTKERTKIWNFWGKRPAHKWLSTASTQAQTWERLQHISDTRTLEFHSAPSDAAAWPCWNALWDTYLSQAPISHIPRSFKQENTPGGTFLLKFKTWRRPVMFQVHENSSTHTEKRLFAG